MTDAFLHRMGVAALAAGVFLSLVWIEWSRHRQDMTHRAAWRVSGAACPRTTAPFAVGARPPKTFAYDEAMFTRRFGHVWCRQFEDPVRRQVYSMCQFSSPGMFEVRVGAQSHRYATGVGKRATITLEDGKVDCVLGGGWGAAERFRPAA